MTMIILLLVDIVRAIAFTRMTHEDDQRSQQRIESPHHRWMIDPLEQSLIQAMVMKWLTLPVMVLA